MLQLLGVQLSLQRAPPPVTPGALLPLHHLDRHLHPPPPAQHHRPEGSSAQDQLLSGGEALSLQPEPVGSAAADPGLYVGRGQEAGAEEGSVASAGGQQESPGSHRH